MFLESYIMIENQDSLINPISTNEEPLPNDVVDLKGKKAIKAILSRVMSIMQYEEFLSEDRIKAVFLTKKSIKEYAYIKHDKDFDNDAGVLKKPHWHIVLRFDDATPHTSVANWFGLEPNWVEVPKGRTPFINCVEYLTHESQAQQKLGKFLYSDDEVISNFDFRQKLTDYQINKLDKKTLNPKERWRVKVMDGLKLKDIPRDTYAIDFVQLDSCRMKYIKEYAPMPSLRLNFYVSGGAGYGKGLISRAIARRIIDPNSLLTDIEIFFSVGSGANRFAGYDGQPVIIWNDFRADALLDAFGGNRGALFNAFDIHPQPANENIKYGSIKLVNTIHVVNSVQTFDEFKKVLCGAEDINQAHRRFPFFVGLNSNDYDLSVNKAFFDNSALEFSQYVMTQAIGANFAKIAKRANNNEVLRKKIENKTLDPVHESYQKVVNNHSQKELSQEEQDAIYDEYCKNSNLELDFKDVPQPPELDLSRPSNSNNNQWGWGGSEFTPY